MDPIEPPNAWFSAPRNRRGTCFPHKRKLSELPVSPACCCLSSVTLRQLSPHSFPYSGNSLREVGVVPALNDHGFSRTSFTGWRYPSWRGTESCSTHLMTPPFTTHLSLYHTSSCYIHSSQLGYVYTQDFSEPDPVDHGIMGHTCVWLFSFWKSHRPQAAFNFSPVVGRYVSLSWKKTRRKVKSLGVFQCWLAGSLS